MATPIVNSVTSGLSSGISLTMTGSFTVPSGLVDAVLFATSLGQSTTHTTQADWNGTVMSQLGSPVGGDFFAAAFYLKNPAPGSHTITFTYDIFGEDRAFTVVLFEHAGTPIGGTQTNSSTGNVATTIPTSQTIGIANSAMVQWFMGDHGMAVTTGAGQTQVQNTNSSPHNWVTQSSYKTNLSIGSQTMTVHTDTGGADNGVYQILSITVPPPDNFFIPQVMII